MNKNKLLHTIVLLLLGCTLAKAVEKGYFISFTDKDDTPYSIHNPEEFLSPKAIERRASQNIVINERDLPVNPAYTDSLKELGIRVKHTTKWLNGCVAFSSDAALMDTLHQYGFIQEVELTYLPYGLKSCKFEPITEGTKSTTEIYGNAYDQINTVRGIVLHEHGFMGENKTIAVIDAGFYGVDHLPVFNHLFQNNQILGTKDFVNPSSNIYEENAHGMYVLSIIGGYEEGHFMGTAPKASFWLIRSEDAGSEYPIEADYWICAAEFADSAGVDIINTSLGYSEFDDSKFNYTYSQMNGTTRISRAATMAAESGMVIVVSAGNEGNSPWHYITAPGDAKNILTIGAMSSDSIKASFSSFGPTYDNRIKPDVTAMGVSTAIQLKNGTIGKGSGTSFSAPVMAGLSACLWDALNHLTAQEISDLIKQSSHQFTHPDQRFGYGIPDFSAAYQTKVDDVTPNRNDNWQAYPNPFNDRLVLKRINEQRASQIEISLYDIAGNKRLTIQQGNTSEIYIDIPAHIQDGMYILHIQDGEQATQYKLFKEGF
jgi:hypothetical protein